MRYGCVLGPSPFDKLRAAGSCARSRVFIFYAHPPIEYLSFINQM